MASDKNIPVVTGRDGSKWKLQIGRKRASVVPPARVGKWVILDIRPYEDVPKLPVVVACRLKGDFFEAVHVVGEGQPQGALSDAWRCWMPLLRPRPDLVEQARQWLQADEDPLAEAADAAIAEDPAGLLELMPPLLGPAFLYDAAPACERVLVSPDGSTASLPPLPIAPDAPRRLGIICSNGPTLVISWDKDNFALIRRDAGRDCRLAWIDGEIVVHPPDLDVVEFFGNMMDSDWMTRAVPNFSLSDDRIQHAVASSFVLGLATFRGLLPRYGVGEYDEERHHAFPPAIIALAETLLLWGLPELAAEFFAAYLLRYVEEDGEINYYGPAISEYGQLLDLAGRIILWGRQHSLLDRVGKLLTGLANRCRQMLIEAAQNDPPVVAGLPEADYHDEQEAYHRPYVSGHLWLLRGIVTFSRALIASQAACEADIAPLLEAVPDQELLEQVAQTAITPLADGQFIPAIAGSDEVFEHMTESREASYTNYRFWPEMLSSGLMKVEDMEKIIDWRRSHGGELMGTTRFEDRLDDWPVWHYAQALLKVGDQDGFVRLLFAHLFHHQTPGWWASYEQVSVVPDEHGWRWVRAGQVVPCQVTVPLMLRAGLLWGTDDGEQINILPAGRKLLQALGGSAYLPVVATAAGSADLYLHLDGEALSGVFRLRPLAHMDDYPRIILPPGVAVRSVVVCELDHLISYAASASLEDMDRALDKWQLDSVAGEMTDELDELIDKFIAGEELTDEQWGQVEEELEETETELFWPSLTAPSPTPPPEVPSEEEVLWEQDGQVVFIDESAAPWKRIRIDFGPA